MDILGNSDSYKRWRDDKLTHASYDIDSCTVEINDPFSLTTAEKNKIQQLCDCNNFALFNLKAQQNLSQAVVQLNRQMGLVDYDRHLYAQSNGLARITQSPQLKQSEFIPYTNKAIGWHTDGYYNTVKNQIRAFSLFCVTPSVSEGTNQWIDPQIVYLLLRENNKDLVAALSHPKAMSIPEHKVDGKVRRAKSVGPIFFIDKLSNELYMRYTQRKKNITLLDSTELCQAVALLDDFLNTKTPFHIEHRMRANQGMLCNNVLHNRSAFIDNPSQPRLLLRGRYFNRISGVVNLL